MIGQLGLRGISVLESAGDTGVGAPCLSNDGTNTRQFTPQFPGTCPFITAVGGTQSISPEVAWTAGSGGFSNYFDRPLYQELFVENYLTNHISKATLEYYKPFTNVNMRGFPDVSAHSLSPNYVVVIDNATAQTGGTSAAAPTFAATIALLNDARFRAGKSALGFLNPWLVSRPIRGKLPNLVDSCFETTISRGKIEVSTRVLPLGSVLYAHQSVSPSPKISEKGILTL